MPLTVRKFKAKVRDSQTGNMIPAGLLSSDALEAIEDAKDAALDTIDDYVDAAEGYASDAAESAVAASENALTGNLAPQYDGTATYQIGDHVIDSNGILYRCNTTISSPQSTFVAAHWTQVKIGPQVDDIIKINQPADDGTKIRVVTSDEDVDLVTVEDLDDYVPRPENDPSGTAGYVLRTNGDGTTQWADEARPTDTQTQNAVNAWMESHSGQYVIPDGNVTEAKLSDDLKLKTIKDYVTPEMFGAVGDGTIEDSLAFQQAINSKKPILLTKSYYIKNVELQSHTEIYGTYETAIITHSGETAFVYTKTVERCIFDGFSIKGAGIGFKYVNKSDYYYFSNCIFRNLAFFSNLSVGVEANLILCRFENCIFGYYGTVNPNGHSHIIVESSETNARQSTDNLFYACRFYFATNISVKLEYSLNNYFAYCNFEQNKCQTNTVYIKGGLKTYFDKCWLELNEGTIVIYGDAGNVYNTISISLIDCLAMLSENSQALIGNYAGDMSIDNCLIFCNNIPLKTSTREFQSYTKNKLYNPSDNYDIKLPIDKLNMICEGFISDRWFLNYTSGTPNGWQLTLIAISSGDSAFKGTGIHYLCSNLGYNYMLYKIKMPGIKGSKLKIVYLANRTSGSDDALRPCYSLDGVTVTNFPNSTPLVNSTPKLYEYSFEAPEDEFYIGLRCGGAIIEGNIYAFDVLYDGNTLINPVIG